MMQVAELAYLAGMLDADGSIDLRLAKVGNLSLRAQVYNTNHDLMDWLVLRFGGHVHEVNRATAERQGWKVEYSWYVNGDAASALLALIAPFMVVKKTRAELAIEAWQNRTPTPVSERRKPIPEGVIEMRERYVSQMRAMNAKGA